MPLEVEKRLKAEARKKGYGKERTNRYVYGTMNKLGFLDKNHAGGPEKVFSDNPLPGIKNPSGVTPPHIIIVVGALFVLFYVIGTKFNVSASLPGVSSYASLQPDQWGINIARSTQDQEFNLVGDVSAPNFEWNSQARVNVPPNLF